MALPRGVVVSACRWMQGDVFTRMRELPDSSVDLIVTSPPFLALRSYLPADHPDKHKEIGSEPTPAAFLSTLLALTREWRRILAPHGSIAVELGDTYSGSGGAGGDYTNDGGFHEGQPTFRQARDRNGWPLAKSLCLIPSLYAGSLAYGHNLLNPADRIKPWRIRNLIVWHRPNPPVGALGDKVRPSTSYITTACVSGQRWFDLDSERVPWSEDSIRKNRKALNEGGRTAENRKGLGDGESAVMSRWADTHAGTAPPLDCWIDDTTPDVWTIPTAPYKGAHYATYPPALPRRLINLMAPREVCTDCGEPRRRITSEPTYEPGPHFTGHGRAKGRPGGWEIAPARIEASVIRTTETLGWTDCDHNAFRRGVVLDPFAGSGTTLAAAAELGRDAIGIDLDERNLDLARDRLGLFLEETA
jgi:site-specific DNA-methyltransferase (adenine-specific)